MKLLKSQTKFTQFKNKKILIMGLGLHGGGVGAVKFFVKAGANVTVTDLRTRQQLKESIDKLKNLPMDSTSSPQVKYVLGKHRKEDFKKADLVIRNPAVPDDSPYIKIARKHKVPIDTDIGVFFELITFVSSGLNTEPVIIGITGTRGKSTTATLIYELLKTKYKNAVLAGNIRKSVLLELPFLLRHCEPSLTWRSNLVDATRVKNLRDCFVANAPRNDTPVIILELSSWQLEGLAKHKLSPHIAVITTIQPDHLNRYKGMKEYIEAKKLISKYQTKDDFLFLNKEDEIVRKFTKKAEANVIFYIAEEARKYKTNLLGAHNQSNIAAAIKVARHFKIEESHIKKILKDFKGLEGRLQLVANIKNVEYINDTTATTPDAAIAAIKTIYNQLSKANEIILIAGGADKNLDFHKLARIISQKVRAVILLEGTATDILEKAILKYTSCHPESFNFIQGKLREGSHSPEDSSLRYRSAQNDKYVDIYKVDSMPKAVKIAYNIAKEGDIVLLSPACASFGMFRHEFERGETFKKTVAFLKVKDKS